MQRVLLFTSDASIAHDAQSSSDLENIDREFNVSFHGLGMSVINNTIKQEIFYLAIASTGIIWETCKMSSKRFKQLSYRDCDLIEAAYQHYLQTLPDQCTSTVSSVVIIDNKTEVSHLYCDVESV